MLDNADDVAVIVKRIIVGQAYGLINSEDVQDTTRLEVFGFDEVDAIFIRMKLYGFLGVWIEPDVEALLHDRPENQDSDMTIGAFIKVVEGLPLDDTNYASDVACFGHGSDSPSIPDSRDERRKMLRVGLRQPALL